MKKITIQHSNDNYYLVDVINISRRINRITLQEEYIMEYIKDGEEWFTPIVNIGGQWYKKPKHESWDDYAFLANANQIINELPIKMLIGEEKNRDARIVPIPNPLDSNKEALIDLLNFIERWYPGYRDGVLENIDTVRRYVINSSIKWSTEMIRNLIPVGTYQNELCSADLWDSNYVRAILNNILAHLMKLPQQERPPIVRFPLTASNPPWWEPPHHNPNYEIDIYNPHRKEIEATLDEYFIKGTILKPERKYYVAYDPELVFNEKLSKKDCQKFNVAYHATKNKGFINTTQDKSAHFDKSFCSDEFYDKLHELKETITSIKKNFGITFMPGGGFGTIVVEREKYIEVYQLEPCNDKEKFKAMREGWDIEIFCAQDNGVKFGSELIIYYSQLFFGGVRGELDINVEAYEYSDIDRYFPANNKNNSSFRRK